MTSEGRDGGLVGGVGVDSRCRCRHVVWVKVVSGGGGRNLFPSGICSVSSTIIVYLEENISIK